MWLINSLDNLMLGKIEGKEKGWPRMRRLDSITDSMDMNLSKLQEIVKNSGDGLQSMGWQRIGHDLATEPQQQSLLLSCHIQSISI